MRAGRWRLQEPQQQQQQQPTGQNSHPNRSSGIIEADSLQAYGHGWDCMLGQHATSKPTMTQEALKESLDVIQSSCLELRRVQIIRTQSRRNNRTGLCVNGLGAKLMPTHSPRPIPLVPSVAELYVR